MVQVPRAVEDVPSRAWTRACDRRGEDLDLSTVAPALDQIISRWRPTQLWLFGSRARGEATTESDWDLLVVVPDDLPEEAFDPVAAWQIRKNAGVRADVIPCRESDFREDLHTPNTLAFEAAVHGVLLYER